MNLSDIIERALKDVPVTKYALGLAAIVILASVVRGAMPDVGLAAMFPLIVGVLVLMTILIVVAAIAADPTKVSGPATLLTWSVSVSLVIVLGASVSALLFGIPTRWAVIILPSTAADKPLIDTGNANETNTDSSEQKEQEPAPEQSPTPDKVRKVPILLRYILRDNQSYIRMTVYVNNLEKATFSLDQKHNRQTFGFSIVPGDRYTIGGTEGVFDPSGSSIREITGSGVFKNPVILNYEIVKGSLNSNKQTYIISRGCSAMAPC